MKVEKFDITFLDGNKKVTASCHEMHIDTKTMIRVCVTREKGRVEVYLYYKVDQLNKMLFWHDLPESQQRRRMEVIADALEKRYNKVSA